MKGEHLGELEELVLLVVCVLHDAAYGVAVQEALEGQAGRSVSISAVHAVLHRLETKGLLASHVGGATKERGGRRKRFFRATAAGRTALADTRRMREQLWDLIPDVTFQGGAS